MKVVHQEIKEGHEKVVAAIQEGFGTLVNAMLKQPVTVRDGGSSSAVPPAPPSGASLLDLAQLGQLTTSKLQRALSSGR